MSIAAWIILYALNSLWWKWIISWGGAQWVEGWRAFFLIEWFALDWTADQIRFYALCIWVFSTIVFVSGFFFPIVRSAGFYW